MSRKSKISKRDGARRVVVAAGLAAADAMRRVDGEIVEDPEADFGGDLDDEELEDNGPPPPPPAPPVNQSDRPSKPPQTLVDLGDPPTDPAAAQAWLHAAMILSARDAMIDSTISAATRRKELRTIAAAAAKLYPDSARYALAKIILKDKEELEARRRSRAGAKVVALPTAGGKVIPIGGQASNE